MTLNPEGEEMFLGIVADPIVFWAQKWLVVHLAEKTSK